MDLSLAYAGYLSHAEESAASAYDLANFNFPPSIIAFLRRAALDHRVLDDLRAFLSERNLWQLTGPSGERVLYERDAVRLVAPVSHPSKAIVVGFSDRARSTAPPADTLPTGFFKLPSTFVTSGQPLLWPRFSAQLDCDACVGLVIGKPGRRIPAPNAWEHVAGLTLLLDVTARDIHQREERTKNNLLGKNFPSSASLGPALLLQISRGEWQSVEVVLTVNGTVRQRFSLGECVFSVEQMIAHWSLVGLEPGDILALGASMVVRDGRLQDRAPVQPGDTVCCSSAAIGELSHPVVSM